MLTTKKDTQTKLDQSGAGYELHTLLQVYHDHIVNDGDAALHDTVVPVAERKGL